MESDPFDALRRVVQITFIAIAGLMFVILFLRVLPVRGKVIFSGFLAVVGGLAVAVVQFGAFEVLRVVLSLGLLVAVAMIFREYALHWWKNASKRPIVWALLLLGGLVAVDHALHWPPSVRLTLWTLGPLPVAAFVGRMTARAEVRRKQREAEIAEKQWSAEQKRLRLAKQEEVAREERETLRRKKDADRDKKWFAERAAEEMKWKEARKLEDERLIEAQEQRDREKEQVERVKREELEARSEGEWADRDLSAEGRAQRVVLVLEKVHFLVWGVAGRTVSLSVVADGVGLEPSRIQSTLDALEARGLIHVRSAILPREWTDKEVELTKSGAELVSSQYEDRRKVMTYNDRRVTYQGDVTAGFIGDGNEVKHVVVDGRRGPSDAYEELAKVVSAAALGLVDPYGVEALEGEASILASSATVEEKNSAVHRVMGMAKLLGAAGKPIIEMANGMKDLLS